MKDIAFTNLSFQGIMALNEFWKLLDGVLTFIRNDYLKIL